MSIDSIVNAVRSVRLARASFAQAETSFFVAFDSSEEALMLLGDFGEILRVNVAFLELTKSDMGVLYESTLQEWVAQQDYMSTHQAIEDACNHSDHPMQWTASGIVDGNAVPFLWSAQRVTLDGIAHGRILIHCQRAEEQSEARSLADAFRGYAEPLPSPERIVTLDRFVNGEDLDRLPDRLECSIVRTCSLLGISSNHWATWRKDRQAPLPNRTAALNVRLLTAYPNLAKFSVLPEAVQQEFMRTLITDISDAEFATMLGLERSAMSRWRRGTPPNEITQALLERLAQFLRHASADDAERYRKMVEIEAGLIGIDNIWKANSWRA